MPASKDWKHFMALEVPPDGEGEEAEYVLVNRSSGAQLGVIYWYKPWRRFVVYPGEETVWSSGCLGHLQEAIRWATGRREKRRAGNLPGQAPLFAREGGGA